MGKGFFARGIRSPYIGKVMEYMLKHQSMSFPSMTSTQEVIGAKILDYTEGATGVSRILVSFIKWV